MCLRIYLHVHVPVFVDNLHSRKQVAPVILVVHSSAVVNHAHGHVNIPEYTEHFYDVHKSRVPGCDNCGVNDTQRYRYIPLFHIRGRCHYQCGGRSDSPN